jgi:penicillin amidase
MRKIPSGVQARPLVAALALVFLSSCSSSGDPVKASASATTSRSLTIKRDRYGVPHVYADTVRGVFHGFGYAVAEDRLFQMEMARRSVLGTVAEVMGPKHAARDADVRQLFTPSSIQAQLARLSQEDRDIFDGYADGFNARMREVLADRGTLLPRQFIDAGFDPAPWTGYDVAMVWVGTMANRFSNGSSEIANLRLLQQLKSAKGDQLGEQLFDQIRWLEDKTAPTTVPRPGGPVQVAPPPSPARKAARGQAQRSGLAPVSMAAGERADALLATWKGMAPPQDRPIASNLWIMGPKKTTDGSTVLVNGPQFGWFNPAYVFGIGLHGAGFDLVGNTPFAHPAVLFGTNGSISWGATAGPQDVNDMYQEQLNPADHSQYRYQGQYRSMGRRIETVKVKGEANRQVEVLSTVHGIVTSVDEASNTAYSMRRSWDGYEIESLLGWIHMMQAHNWDEFLKQAARVAITINWYYADAKGNIGYVSPGRLPIRPAAQDIRLPALGDGTMEWLGIKPFEQVPRIYNPAQGYIVNWNNQPAPGALTDGGNFSFVDRVNELIFRIEAQPRFTPEQVWALNRQTSFADTNARYFVPYILAATRGLPPTDPVRKAAWLLASWNGLSTNPDDGPNYIEPATTVMRAWLPIMYRKLLADDLPAEVFAQFSSAGYPAASPQAASGPAMAPSCFTTPCWAARRALRRPTTSSTARTRTR